MQSTDLKVREDVVRGLYLEGVEELYVASREVGTQSSDQQHPHTHTYMLYIYIYIYIYNCESIYILS
jgi:hypothetical protein